MNTVCLTIYLDIFDFFHQHLWFSAYRSCKFLLDLYLSICFGLTINDKYILKKIQFLIATYLYADHVSCETL